MMAGDGSHATSRRRRRLGWLRRLFVWRRTAKVVPPSSSAYPPSRPPGLTLPPIQNNQAGPSTASSSVDSADAQIGQSPEAPASENDPPSSSVDDASSAAVVATTLVRLERDGKLAEARRNHVRWDFSAPVPFSATGFNSFVAKERGVRDRLADQSIELLWPSKPVTDGLNLVGYEVPSPSASFFFSVDGKLVRRTLDWAVIRTNVPGEAPATHQQRVALFLQIGRLLDAMHAEGVVLGDAAWNKFMFRLAPSPSICMFRFESSRLIGWPTHLGPMNPELTQPWRDSHIDLGADPSFDSDRFAFGLLGYRLLVSGDLDSNIADEIPDSNLSWCGNEKHERLRVLWKRVAGEAGTRPQVSEWLAALS